MHPSPAPKKRLSQNFLTDKNILKKIVEASGIMQDDTVLEIGCGHGALTEWVLKTGCRLKGIEYDAPLIPILREKFGTQERFQIIEGDILELDIHHLFGAEKIKIIGNLPYHISSPILFKLFEHRVGIDSATIMLQKEVAERLVSSPRTKDYGILSVFCQYHCMAKKCFDIAPAAFHPKPKVDSAIIHLQFRDFSSQPRDYEFFKMVVKRSFNQRRKMLRNSLSGILEGRTIEFNLQKRPEELTVEEFVALSNLIYRKSS
jgi:16S rRNA (adenine1518-N6/adenine1519-N6)-dimethyltransferase